MKRLIMLLKRTRLTIVLVLLTLGASTALATSFINSVNFNLATANGPVIIDIEAKCSADAFVVVTDLATGAQVTYQHGGPLYGNWTFTIPMQPGQRYQVDIYCLGDNQVTPFPSAPHQTYWLDFVAPGHLDVY